jgi:hypothetical protein
MASAEQLVNAGGEIKIGRVSIFVRELPLAGEIRLRNKLAAMARDALGPGSFYANTLPVADWLRSQGRHGEASALLQTTGEMVANKSVLSGPAVDEFNQTPEGLVEELFWRSRADQPDLTRAEIAAVINDANADDVSRAIERALDPKKAAIPAASSDGS